MKPVRRLTEAQYKILRDIRYVEFIVHLDKEKKQHPVTKAFRNIVANIDSFREQNGHTDILHPTAKFIKTVKHSDGTSERTNLIASLQFAVKTLKNGKVGKGRKEKLKGMGLDLDANTNDRSELMAEGGRAFSSTNDNCSEVSTNTEDSVAQVEPTQFPVMNEGRELLGKGGKMSVNNNKVGGANEVMPNMDDNLFQLESSPLSGMSKESESLGKGINVEGNFIDGSVAVLRNNEGVDLFEIKRVAFSSAEHVLENEDEDEAEIKESEDINEEDEEVSGIEQVAFVSEENGLKGKENEKPPTDRKRVISKGRESSRKRKKLTPLASKNKQEVEKKKKKKKKKKEKEKEKEKDTLPEKEVATRVTRRSTRKRK